MVPFSFAGHQWRALADGAVFWPANHALLVADLHFEKASWFAARGQMLPPYDSLATLTRIEALVATTGATRLFSLGDSFHDIGGPERLCAEACDRLTRLAAQIEWTWITGNHDAALPDTIGRSTDEMTIDGVVLRHAADPRDRRPELSGHYHPKIRVASRGRSVARRCFVMSETKLMLPAFGALTGGLDARHPEIMRVAGRDAEALIALGDRLLRFRLAA